MSALPKPLPIYTVSHEVDPDGKPWCRVRLDAGQYSFRAGMELRGVGLGEAASRLINAMGSYAHEQGWIADPEDSVGEGPQ